MFFHTSIELYMFDSFIFEKGSTKVLFFLLLALKKMCFYNLLGMFIHIHSSVAQKNTFLCTKRKPMCK